MTYYDHRNSITTTYADNEVNEYTYVGSNALTYDAAGNLSKDENEYEYLYDYKNRLTKITYIGSGSTQVPAFEYDALGRMISSQLRFDADESAMSETLKYYYDGSNVIAEYDESDNISRKYIHGTSGIDERAVLIEGDGRVIDTPDHDYAVDSYYYLLAELGTVTGLITRNGTLAEAYTYDAYGNVSLWGYRPMDFNRDGGVDRDGSSGDMGEWLSNYGAIAPCDAMADANLDGIVDYLDLSYLYFYFTGDGEPPITLHTSAIGNPYFFTGRRMQFFETLDDGSPGDVEANRRVQYNRARHYHPVHGRWLQRDPAGYVGGMNLYEYLRSNPLFWTDPSGLGPYKIGTAPPPHPHGPFGQGHGSQTGDADSANFWQLADQAATAAWFVYDDASKHLKHYLGNSGTEYTIDARGLFTEDSQAKRLFYSELNRAMRFVEGKAQGRNRGFHLVSKTWDKGFTERNTNWYYATYQFRAYGDGPAEILPNCRYRLRFAYHFDDPYDWHARMKVTIMGITITDDLMRHLHLTGLAREFHMVGRYTKTVTWEKGQYFDVNTGSLKNPGGR